MLSAHIQSEDYLYLRLWYSIVQIPILQRFLQSESAGPLPRYALSPTTEHRQFIRKSFNQFSYAVMPWKFIF